MIVPKYLRTALMTGVSTIVIAVAMPAMAQDRQQAQIDELRQIIQQQQQELNRLRSKIDRVDQQQKSTTQAVKDARTASASVDAGRKPHKAGAIAIPGTNFDFKFGGYAKADFIYSSGDEASGAEDLFVVPLINTRDGDGSDDQVKVHARQSRINFEVANPDTAFGPVRAFVEGDFFGAGGNEVISNSTSLRLRHAYGQLGNLLAGQTWTTFMDVSAIPGTLDFEGPGAESFIRQAQFRYTFPIAAGTTLALAVENPEGRVLNAAGATVHGEDDFPDVVAQLRTSGKWGHLQLAGVGRNITAPDGASGDEVGFALGLTGTLNIPTGVKDKIQFGAYYADGGSRYILDTAIAGYDAAVNPVTGNISTVEARSIYAALTHFWTPSIRSTVVGSFVEFDSPSFAANTTFDESRYFVGNLVWSPIPRVDLGIEALYGERTDKDGASGNQFRTQTSALYRF